MCYLLDREGTERDVALGGNKIPFGYKLEMPIDHPSGGVKEADLKGLFLQEQLRTQAGHSLF